MPNRILREGIIDSERVNKLSWAAEVFYRRLMSVVDDYGRYDGRAEILRVRLYPLKIDVVSQKDIISWLKECIDAQLVRMYTVEGKTYIEILNFNQTIRIKKPKYPAPAPDSYIEIEEEKEQPVIKRATKSECLFRNSKYYDKEKFKEALAGTKYEAYDLDYYYEAVLNWSDSKGVMRKDWIAQARNFILKDIANNKAKTNGQQIGLKSLKNLASEVLRGHGSQDT
jgi:activator of HSP90 ATPase